jgi:nitrite reductase/ring-hydroxylating ferredoxin subunit
VTLVDVGDESEFDDGRLRIVDVGGKELGVLRWGEAWYAVRNVCPHLGAPVCLGRVQPLVTAAGAHSLVVDRARPVLMCPWHRWEFDLDTGAAIGGRDAIRRYAVSVDGGRVLVDDGAQAGGHSDASRPESHRA